MQKIFTGLLRATAFDKDVIKYMLYENYSYHKYHFVNFVKINTVFATTFAMMNMHTYSFYRHSFASDMFQVFSINLLGNTVRKFQLTPGSSLSLLISCYHVELQPKNIELCKRSQGTGFL